MANTKYVGDYRLENVPHPRTGKIVTRPMYRGEWFAFAAGAKEIRRLKRIVPALSVLIAAAFIAVLLLNAPCGHIYYVMVPFAAMIFPVFFLLAGCWRLLTAGERVTREHKDKLTGRLTGCPLFILFFSTISACGHGFYALQAPMTARDVISAACALAIAACAGALFALRGRFAMRSAGSAAKEGV